jgi:hypothetical protein
MDNQILEFSARCHVGQEALQNLEGLLGVLSGVFHVANCEYTNQTFVFCAASFPSSTCFIKASYGLLALSVNVSDGVEDGPRIPTSEFLILFIPNS